MGFFGKNSAAMVVDPICGMRIDPKSAFANEVHEGKTFYFCSQTCRDTFRKDPHRYGHP